jgi:hypothetical protein
MINSGGFADTPIHRISLHTMLPPYYFELQKRNKNKPENIHYSHKRKIKTNQKTFIIAIKGK